MIAGGAVRGFVHGRRRQGDANICFVVESPRMIDFNRIEWFVLATLFEKHRVEGIPRKAGTNGRTRRGIPKAKVDLKSLGSLHKEFLKGTAVCRFLTLRRRRSTTLVAGLFEDLFAVFLALAILFELFGRFGAFAGL